MPTAASKSQSHSNGNKFQLSLALPTDYSLTAGTNIPPPPPSPPLNPKPATSPAPHTGSRSSAPLKTAYSSSHLRGDASNGPQSPGQADSPNPLRSHPTSSHSLGRKFSGSPLVHSDQQQPPPRTPDGGGAGGGGPPQKRAPDGSPASSRFTGSGAQSEGVASPQPPSKRPLSVRKLLSLRALNNALGRTSIDSSSSSKGQQQKGGSGMQGYANGTGKKSSDNLSMFSFARSDTGTSERTPSLRRKRSSAFWGRRGSTFFGSVAEEEEGGAGAGAGAGATERERKKTPPPTLPEVKTLGKGYREKDGGFLGGDDMFKDIK